MENLERALSLNSVKYYNDIRNFFSQFQDVNLLKQHYSQKSKLITIRNNVDMPAKDTKTSVRCPRCCMNRKQNNSQYRIDPAKRYQFLNKINKKVNSGKLTKYQQKYAKRIHKYFGNQLVIKCNICQTEVKVSLSKPKNKKLLKPQAKLHGQNNNNNEKKKPVLNSTNLMIPKGNKKKAKKRSSRTSNLQISKLNNLLNTSREVKTTNLKEFIKSVT